MSTSTGVSDAVIKTASIYSRVFWEAATAKSTACTWEEENLSLSIAPTWHFSNKIRRRAKSPGSRAWDRNPGVCDLLRMHWKEKSDQEVREAGWGRGGVESVPLGEKSWLLYPSCQSLTSGWVERTVTWCKRAPVGLGTSLEKGKLCDISSQHSQKLGLVCQPDRGI